MIISCEKCATKYNVNSAFIGLDGRKVKCTACKYIWHAVLPQEEQEKLKNEQPSQQNPVNSINSSEKVTPEKDQVLKQTKSSSFMPAIIDRQVPLWLKVAPVTILLLSLAIYLVFYSHHLLKIVPQSAGVYRYFGVYNTEGLILQDIALHKLANEGEYFDILIKGKIVNHSLEERHMPGLRLSILDEEGKNIVSSISNPDDSILTPGEEFVINNKITNLDKQAKYLAIDIGDKVELVLR
jgi:predicted Zn finger-like uncharacterized protein